MPSYSPATADAAPAGGAPMVRVRDGSGAVVAELSAYEPGMTAGVRVAVAELTGDGVPDIVTAPMAGGGPRVRVFDGATLSVVSDYFAYEPEFLGGVTIAAGPLGGGLVGVVTGTGAGGGPRVRVFTPESGVLAEAFAHDPADRRGVAVKLALSEDGTAVLTASGANWATELDPVELTPIDEDEVPVDDDEDPTDDDDEDPVDDDEDDEEDDEQEVGPVDLDGDGEPDCTILDLDGDGEPDEIDGDGDGILDGVGLDLNGDGLVDSVGSDTDGDGSFDGVDLDGDGEVDGEGVDLDGDGVIDSIALGGGRPAAGGGHDQVDIDGDGDGIPDGAGIDTDGDGAIDGIDTDGDEDADDTNDEDEVINVGGSDEDEDDNNDTDDSNDDDDSNTNDDDDSNTDDDDTNDDDTDDDDTNDDDITPPVYTPTFTPVVDGTLEGYDDYSLVGKAVDFGYRIAGVAPNSKEMVQFRVDSGPGQFTGASWVQYQADATGSAYVYTAFKPAAPQDFYVSALLHQGPTGKSPPPAPSPLPAKKVAGIQIFIGSEGSAPVGNGSGRSFDDHIRSASTPAAMTADRIRPRLGTNVYVGVRGNVPGGALKWLVTGQSDTNGRIASGVAPAPLPAPGPQAPGGDPTTQLSVVSIAGAVDAKDKAIQTNPGSAGQLQFTVTDANKPGKLLVSSHGFSVSAIPNGVKMTALNAVNAVVVSLGKPAHPAVNYRVSYGYYYAMQALSDSNKTEDLNQVIVKEIIDNVRTQDMQNPPQPNRGFWVAGPLRVGTDGPASTPKGDLVGFQDDLRADSEAEAAANSRRDTIASVESRGWGTQFSDQYIEFADQRTGGQRLPVAASGFTQRQDIQVPANVATGVARLTTLKRSSAVTIKGVTVAAGTAAAESEAAFAIDITRP